MSNRTPSRRGSAILMVMAIVFALAALTYTLSTNTVARMQAERSRDDQVELLAACESAANEAVSWMQSNTALITALALNPQPNIINTNATPEAQYNYVIAATFPAAAKLTSATYNDPVTGMVPQLKVTRTDNTTYTAIGCDTNMRNGCQVDCIITCLTGTPAGKTFPDGSERFLIFATATKGNKGADAARYQRRRVMTMVCPLPMQTFKQTMYAISSFDVGGSAGTDGWAGPNVVYDPSASIGTGATDRHKTGDVYSGTGVTKSGSSDIQGNYGKKTPPLQLPSLTYDPPVGATALGKVSSNVSLTGGATYRASQVTTGGDILVQGSGTVTLYVDGPFSTDSIRYAPGSTATLVIKQANYDPTAYGTSGATNFDLSSNAEVGDINEVKSGGNTTYTSENDPTKGPNAARLQFYTGYTGDMTFNGTGDLAAVIYAPQANVKMNGTFQFFGSIVADGFDGKVNGTFNFHYDESLGSLTLPLSPQFSATGWNIYNVAVNQN